MSRSLKNFIMIFLLIICVLIIYQTMILANKTLVTEVETNIINYQNEMGIGMPPPPRPEGGEDMPPPSPPTDFISNNNVEISMITNNVKLTLEFYIYFILEGFVLAVLVSILGLTSFNKYKMNDCLNTNEKTNVFIIVMVIFTLIFAYLEVKITNIWYLRSVTNYSFQGPSLDDFNKEPDVEVNAVTVYDGIEETKENENYESTDLEDTAALTIKNRANVELQNITVTKNGGDTKNTEQCDFYGINAGIVVKDASNVNIDNSNITTNAKGGNGIFARSKDTKVVVTNTKIITTGEKSSRGLTATFGGTIEANNINIDTKGISSTAIGTDRAGGFINVENSRLTTNGKGSPIAYSTGDIKLNNCNGSANSAQIFVVDGCNYLTVDNCKFDCNANPFMQEYDKSAILLYHTIRMNLENKQTVTINNSELTINKKSENYKLAPAFFITNNDVIINLNNTIINYGSNILITAIATDGWGVAGENGAKVEFNANNQKLEGDIVLDELSSINLNMMNSSFKGCINNDNKSLESVLKIDSKSTVTLTGDSYVKELIDEDETYSNINFNGYKLYVDGIELIK